MNRRSLLGMTACTVGLAGCISNEDPHEMSEGSTFIRLHRVDDDFSGTVRIVPSCRDETVEIQIDDGQPDGSIPYVREESGEECSFEIFIDDEHAETASVGRSELGNIRIFEDGKVFFGSDII